jgi:hypothetical protein
MRTPAPPLGGRLSTPDLQLPLAAGPAGLSVGRKPAAQHARDLGVSLELLGKWKSALDAYERALQLDARAIEAEKAVAALKRMLAN